jgi:hypothetical protein
VSEPFLALLTHYLVEGITHGSTQDPAHRVREHNSVLAAAEQRALVRISMVRAS